MNWPTNKLAIYWGLQLDSIDVSAYLATYRRAVADINAACGVELAFVSQVEAANLWVVAAPIDRAGTDIALTEMPYPGISGNARLMQWFDSADLPGLNQHEFYVAALHEIGHFLGRQHSAAGILSVMSPVLNFALQGLTAYDDAELVELCGPPAKRSEQTSVDARMDLRSPVGPIISGFPFFVPYAGRYTLGPISLQSDIAEAGRYQVTITIEKQK